MSDVQKPAPASAGPSVPRSARTLGEERRFRRIARQAAIYPGLIAIALSATLVGLVWHLERLHAWVRHTDAVIERGYRLQTIGLEEETAVRGFLLTGDPDSLSRIGSLREQAHATAMELRRLVSDNPAQVERLDAIAARASSWNHFADAAIAARREGPISPERFLAERRGGRTLIDELGRDERAFISTEEALRSERTRRASTATTVTVVLGCGLSLALGFVITLLATRQLARVQRRYRRAIQAQREDHDKLVLAQQVSRAGTYEWNAKTDVNRWSPELELLYGLRPGTFPGTYEAWKALVHPDDFPQAHAKITDAMRTGEFNAEFRIVRPDGEVRWLVARGQFLRDESGEPERLIGFNFDVTDRKQVEEALREKQERLEAALDAARTGTFRWDIRSNGLSWDENLDRLFGLEPGRTVRSLDAFLALVHPDDRAGVIAQCRECARSGADFDMEFRVVWPDGSIHWLIDRGKTWKDAAGVPLYMTGACADITELRRADEALRLSEARFRQLADSMPQIVWTASPDGSVDYYNHRWFEITGAPLDDPNYAPTIHPEDRERTIAAWKESVRNGTPHEVECRLWVKTRDAYCWFLVRALPIRDASGRVERWFGTSTEIEEQKRTERELAEADRRKDQFLAMLAHELRNPLAPIRSAVELLRLKGADAGTEKYRAIIERQTTVLTRIVDDLLDVSRVTRGAIELRREPVDLAALLARAVETSRPLVDAREQRIELVPPPEPLVVNADPERTVQIFANLINNAAKYSPEGASIQLSAARAGDAAEVSVRDQGRGIPADKLDAIFSMFTQLEPTIDRTHGGLGIGLTLVRALAELHGGSVRVHSAGPGQGSEFTVRLPLSRDAARSGSGLSRPPPPRRTNARRVLVLDDNRDAADVLGELVSGMGDEVHVAYDPHIAVELALRDRFDVALLDLGLPGMDGFEVARRIRAARRPMVLVALSGYGQPADRERAREAGFDHHLVKPAEPAEISAILDGRAA